MKIMSKQLLYQSGLAVLWHSVLNVIQGSVSRGEAGAEMMNCQTFDTDSLTVTELHQCDLYHQFYHMVLSAIFTNSTDNNVFKW